ncbi:MAG: hypothetical protein C1943_18770 [Halochromatium sp.]|nr:hypothetical protein [Halochromatium sp.]
MHLPCAPQSLASLLVVPLCVASLTLFGQASAQPPYPLNDTGSYWCSDADSSGLDCPVEGYPGQDAEFGRDVTNNDHSDGYAGFSFTKLDAQGNDLPATAPVWSCVRDNVTGTVWEVKTNDRGLRDKRWTYTWYESTANSGTCATNGRCDTEKYVEDVNITGLCGFNDWRLPTIKELYGIVINDSYSPVDSYYFPNTQSSRYRAYWSGSEYDNDYAWEIDFNYIYIYLMFATSKINDNYVRLVRSEQQPSSSSFINNGDGTITEANNGLMWARCSAGQSGPDCSDSAAIKMNWQQALNYAEDMVLAGYNDWRVPNIKELQSLVNYDANYLGIDESFFPSTPAAKFWSSSSSVFYRSLALQIPFYLSTHSSLDEDKTNELGVRLVRDVLPLTITITGDGNGMVSSEPVGINCGSDCSEDYSSGTEVLLTATPAIGSELSSWSEDSCGIATRCKVIVDSAKTVTATFSEIGGTINCASTAHTLTRAFTIGIHQYYSEVLISVSGSVQINPNAKLYLGAPRINFEPGFQVTSGGHLSAIAKAVTCSREASRLVAGHTDMSSLRHTLDPVAAQLVTIVESLPGWIQAKLATLGIQREFITSALINQDGNWLILETTQALQTSDQNDASDLYRLDLLEDQLQLISATEQGQAGNGPSRYPAADASGERIVFHSEADDLVPLDSNQVSDLFLRDLALGQTAKLTHAEQASANPALDAGGETLVYDQASAEDQRQVFERALASGSVAERLSLHSDTDGIRIDAHHPAISADGRFIAYLEHPAVGDAANPDCQVHLYDRETEVYHRQLCPDALASEETSVRGVFSEDAQRLEWYLPGVAEPIRLSNPLAP